MTPPTPTPEIISGHGSGHGSEPGMIRIHLRWWSDSPVRANATQIDKDYLNLITISRILCPPVIYVLDTPKAREILGLPQALDAGTV